MFADPSPPGGLAPPEEPASVPQDASPIDMQFPSSGGWAGAFDEQAGDAAPAASVRASAIPIRGVLVTR